MWNGRCALLLALGCASPAAPADEHAEPLAPLERAERCAELRAVALPSHEARPAVRVAPERAEDIDPEPLRALVALGYVSAGGP